MVVHKQLVKYLESNELITVWQSGFRSSHSYETALQWVLTDWKNAIGDRQMVFLDLKRTFEVVDRRFSNKKTATLWFEGCGIGMVQMLSRE